MEFLKALAFYDADGGAPTGDPAPSTDPTPQPEKVVFTPEQQAKLDELIKQAFAKGAKKAKADGDNLQAERDALATEKAELEKERKTLAATKALAKVGYTIEGDEGDLLVAVVAGEDCGYHHLNPYTRTEHPSPLQ